MPRPEKVQAVEEIRERFSDATASFITEYRGLTVGQQQNLRNALREAGASYKVFKLTLTKLALDELGTNDLDEFLVGPTAIAFASEDPVPVAKALKDFGVEHEALVIKAGWMNGEVLAPEMVAKLASLESRDVLLAKIAGAAKAPLTKMAGFLGSMTRDAASMFSQLLERKEEEAPAEEAPATEEASAEEEAVEEPFEDAAEPVPAAEVAAEDTTDDESPAEEPTDQDEPAAQDSTSGEDDSAENDSVDEQADEDDTTPEA